MRLAAERAADDIRIDDGLKELDYDKDVHLGLKEVDTDTISVVSHQSELKHFELNDVDDDGVLVDLDLDNAVEERKDSEDADSDSVESVGSQLVRLAAGH